MGLEKFNCGCGPEWDWFFVKQSNLFLKNVQNDKRQHTWIFVNQKKIVDPLTISLDPSKLHDKL